MDKYFLNWGRQIDMQPSMTYISFAVLPMIFYLLVKVSFHGIFYGPGVLKPTAGRTRAGGTQTQP